MSGGRGPTVLGVSLKLYLTVEQSARWAERIAELAGDHPAVQDGRVELFVLPSLPAAPAVQAALAGTPVGVGAQDLFWEDRGPYTGGVSGADLRATGLTLVEVGHSERRRWFGEDEAVVNLKLAAAFRNGLEPVLCVGERVHVSPQEALEECAGQLESALFGIPPASGAPLTVAYEPVWAIGGEESAEPEHVDVVCAGLHDALRDHPWLGDVRVIYGGSAQPGLLPRLGAGVDGLFLGRFAHDPAAVAVMVDEAMALR